MRKKQIIDTELNFIHVDDVIPGDIIICRDAYGVSHICVWCNNPVNSSFIVNGADVPFWSIINMITGLPVADAMNFVDFFNNKNSTNKPLTGWTFSLIED